MPPKNDATALGWFNFARSFHRAADALSSKDLKRKGATHGDAVITYLYYHCIEVYLKALLVHCGREESELLKIGHDFSALAAEFEACGGFLMDEDKKVIELIVHDGNLLRARYIRTGSFTRASFGALSRTALSLEETVGQTLRDAGINTR